MFTEFNNSKCHHFIGFMDECLSPSPLLCLSLFVSLAHIHNPAPPTETITDVPSGSALQGLTEGLYPDSMLIQLHHHYTLKMQLSGSQSKESIKEISQQLHPYTLGLDPNLMSVVLTHYFNHFGVLRNTLLLHVAHISLYIFLFSPNWGCSVPPHQQSLSLLTASVSLGIFRTAIKTHGFMLLLC